MSKNRFQSNFIGRNFDCLKHHKSACHEIGQNYALKALMLYKMDMKSLLSLSAIFSKHDMSYHNVVSAQHLVSAIFSWHTII